MLNKTFFTDIEHEGKYFRDIVARFVIPQKRGVVPVHSFLRSKDKETGKEKMFTKLQAEWGLFHFPD